MSVIIPPLRHPVADKAGVMTQPWQRYFQDLQALIGTGGGGIPASVAVVAAFAGSGALGPDYGAAVTALSVELASQWSESSRITALEQRITSLEVLLNAAVNAPDGIENLEARVALISAMVFSND